MMENQNVETVGEIARKDFRKAEILKKTGIDFCCGGKKTLAEACADKGLNLQEVLTELQKAETTLPGSEARHDFDSWPLSFLVDYIINVHHNYVKNNVELLDELSERVARKHGDHTPELIEIRTTVVALLEELTDHLQKEENILFPFVKQMESGQNTTFPASAIQQPIFVMEQEHEAAGKMLKKLRALTNNYSVPPNACNSFNLLYKKLEEFEADLHQHIHLENNILFPKTAQL